MWRRDRKLREIGANVVRVELDAVERHWRTRATSRQARRSDDTSPHEIRAGPPSGAPRSARAGPSAASVRTATTPRPRSARSRRGGGSTRSRDRASCGLRRAAIGRPSAAAIGSSGAPRYAGRARSVASRRMMRRIVGPRRRRRECPQQRTERSGSRSSGARTASTFSRPRGSSCDLVATIRPRSAATARLFHGSPTQKPSTCPARRLSTMRGGGMATSRRSRSGLRPAARANDAARSCASRTETPFPTSAARPGHARRGERRAAAAGDRELGAHPPLRSSRRTACFDTVIALPPRPSTNGTTAFEVCNGHAERRAIGNGASACAQSR